MDLDAIKFQLRLGRFQITPHAFERMIERNVRMSDIKEVGYNAYKCVTQKNGRFKVMGYDVDGDALSVVAEYADGVWIVTVTE